MSALLVGILTTFSLPLLADAAAKPVKLMSIEAGEDGVKRAFFGRVTARQTVDLAFQVPGQLVKFPAIEGELIAKGAMVAQLDLEPFQLALDRAKASEEKTIRTLNRLEQLQGYSPSRASVDDARTASVIASVATRDAEYALERAILTAPFDAIVATRSLANFSTIGAGTPIVRLHDMSELQIEIDVPEILFQRTGDNPNLELSARFPASATLYPLEYREVDAEASRIGQTFRVTLGMRPPEDLLLLPGASVTVFATILDAPSGITVPASAIHKGLDGVVSVLRYVAEDDQESGTLALTPVEIRIGEAGDIQLLSGISEGDQIVASGVDVLADQQRVRPFTSF
ncbi:hemolysin D [Marinobacter psychrophilus]|uniref:Hemolysin D n=2 Tax=Marinobacter psychrophilus TaxID=330734 RepID=A0A0H4I9L8_9GAMM|nr:hemolysin D [Marinobacter psychrophilus]